MKYLSFILVSILLFGCNEAVQYGPELISFSDAWAYAFTQKSYVNLLVLGIILASGGFYWVYRDYTKTQNVSITQTVVGVVALGILLGTLLGVPANIAANTTVEAAARGNYIGW